MTGFTFGISPLFNWESVGAALSGGILLGCSTVFKTACLSGVLGISNYTKRLVVDPELKRYFFIVGMVLGSLGFSRIYSGTEDLPPASDTQEQRRWLFVRMAVGGWLVGLGAATQHGCTSGHGLTGLARLSPRSWVAVPAFMAAGMATATLLSSAGAFKPQPESEEDWEIGAICAAEFIAFLILAAVILKIIGSRCAHMSGLMLGTLLVGEFIVGCTFGCGLLISGMARPSKVITFLDLGSGHWDLTLMFVMGGALCITFPYFQALQHLNLQSKSFLHESNLDLPPPNRMPDWGLVAGAVTFGAGWGICGMCPGPIWTNLGAAPSWEILVVLLAMVLGVSTPELSAKLRTTLCGRSRKDEARKADDSSSEEESTSCASDDSSK